MDPSKTVGVVQAGCSDGINLQPGVVGRFSQRLDCRQPPIAALRMLSDPSNRGIEHMTRIEPTQHGKFNETRGSGRNHCAVAFAQASAFGPKRLSRRQTVEQRISLAWLRGGNPRYFEIVIAAQNPSGPQNLGTGYVRNLRRSRKIIVGQAYPVYNHPNLRSVRTRNLRQQPRG